MDIHFDPTQVPTPYYVVEEQLLLENLKILKEIKERADCKILLAQKAFSMFSLYSLIGQYLDGTTASGLFEAKLGYEEMGKETHVFSPAYKPEEFTDLLSICDHLVFNSFDQWEKYRSSAIATNKKFGIRINPECSTGDHAIYDPCSPYSRLGVTKTNFRPDLLEGISGLHFHTLCEQNAQDLITTLEAVEEKFGVYLKDMEWVNFGGGHHITRSDYDREALISCIQRFKERYQLTVYLEPGEAVALNTGFLVASVLDVIDNGMKIAILDASAACHMPDVIEMPYRPMIKDADLPGQKSFTYRLGGPTCLAGDIIGDYSFDRPLVLGDRLIFGDMAHYTMVKNNTFNGMNLPSIVIAGRGGQLEVVRQFGYEDFKGRLS